MSLISCDLVSLYKEKEDSETTQGEGSQGEMKIEIEVILPQVQELQGPPEARNGQRKAPSLQGSEGVRPSSGILIYTYSLQNCEMIISVVLRHPIHDTLLQQE